MWIWPLLFILSAIAQDQASEIYCFQTPSVMERTVNEVKTILLPIDQITKDGLCFTVSTKSHRIDLIQGYVKRIEPSVHISLSHLQQKSEPCRLKVEKEKELQLEDQNASIGQSIEARTEQSSQKQRETMQVQTLGSFELKFNQMTFQGHCTLITPQHYVIKAKFKREPLLRPITTQAPHDTQAFFLETTIDLKREDRIELGSLLKKIDEGQTKINLASEVTTHSLQKNQNEKVFLSLE